MKCDLCGKQYKGFGNNASPFRGNCCDECNEELVIPLRVYLSGMCKDQILILNASDNSITTEAVEGDEVGLERLQSKVEGYIELYPKRDKHFYFIVNEEGLIHGLPLNKLAYQIFNIEVFGNLVVCPKGLFK